MGDSIQIRRLRPDQVEAAKRVIITVCQELFGTGPTTPAIVDRVVRRWDEEGAFQDINDGETYDSANRGLFLVLLDGGDVVGTGAIRRLDDTTCELKRMWFLKAYRGRGLGSRMAHRLLRFAKSAGYRTVRLDAAHAGKQEQALKLYRRLGFDFIERYNDGPCSIFMEKPL
jgi:putative acetyltransferase